MGGTVAGVAALAGAEAGLVGRGAELERLARLRREGARLVTIVGPPGMGKTRFARAYGAMCLRAAEEVTTATLQIVGGGSSRRTRASGDSSTQAPVVWFVDVTAARTPTDVMFALATSLSVSLSGADDVEALVARVAAALVALGACTIVVDNFEQVAQHATSTVAPLLARAPLATLIVTSRRRLALRDEVLFELAPLSTGDSVTLFATRAARPRGDEAFVPDERAAVEELVRRLGCMPLAIELAAARAHLLSPRALIDRLAGGIDVLARRTIDGEERHASMRAAIEGSWTLLDAFERIALAQCSAFRGGFTIREAEQVLELGADAPPTIDVLDALVSHSLLHVMPRAEVVTEPRLTAYEGIAELAAEKLRESGTQHEVWERHARVYAALANLLRASFMTSLTVEPIRARSPAPEVARRDFERALMERDNLLAAVDRMFAAHSAVGVHVALGLEPLLWRTGPGELHRSIAAMTRALARELDMPIEEMRSLNALFADDGNRGRLHEALGHADELGALLARTPNAILETIHATATLWPNRLLGNLELAVAAFRRADALAAKHGFHRLSGYSLGQHAMTLGQCGDDVAADSAFERSVALAEEYGTREDLAMVVGNHADLLALRGNLGQLADQLDRFGEMLGGIAHWQFDVGFRVARGELRLFRGDLAGAEEDLTSVLDRIFEERQAADMARGPTALARLWWTRGRRDEGFSLIGRATRAAAPLDVPSVLALLHETEGILQHEAGAPDRAGRSLQRAADAAARGDVPRQASVAMNQALLLVDTGDAIAARELLEGAAKNLPATHHGLIPATALACLATVCLLLGDQGAARKHCARATELLVACDAPETVALVRWASLQVGHDDALTSAERASAIVDVETTAPAHWLTFARLRRIVGACLAVTAPSRTLVVAMDGRSFALDGKRTELARRRALRLVLLALVHRRRDEPGAALTQDDVLAGGWPGERVRAESGAKRVYTTINLLRTLGLRDVLVTRDDGYLLDPEVALRLED